MVAPRRARRSSASRKKPRNTPRKMQRKTRRKAVAAVKRAAPARSARGPARKSAGKKTAQRSSPAKRARKSTGKTPRQPAARSPALVISVVVAGDAWPRPAAARATVRKAITAAAASQHPRLPAQAGLTVLLADNDVLQRLNRQWRGKNKPTNVLSFPAIRSPAAPPRRRAARAALGKDPPELYLGDIAIAYQVTRGEAAAAGQPLAHHLAHLAVHGFLHLLGYDHESDGEAQAMEDAERAILAGLGVPDPYDEGGSV